MIAFASKSEKRKLEETLKAISAYHFERARSTDVVYEDMLKSHKDASKELVASMIERRNKHLEWSTAINTCLDANVSLIKL